ncbi:MAG: hypothetical protein QM698_14800 [Micropepsaceae bacterium]
MTVILMAAQSVSAEGIIDQMGMPAYIGLTLVGAVVAALIVGLLLKFVGGSVLGHPVKYGSAFTAIFITVLVAQAIEFALVQGGVIPQPSFDPQASLVDQIMPNGPVIFAIVQAISFLLLTWAIRAFLKGPDDEPPSWSNALMISLVMTVILIAFAVILLKLNAGMQPG